MPNEGEFVAVAGGHFEKYGLITVFFSAILEGMFLVGLYYPVRITFLPFCDIIKKINWYK